MRTREVCLDEVDRKILQILAANSRVSNNAIAQLVGVAASTCHLRVRRLREIGAIRGFHADLSPELLGMPLQALVSVRLQAHARSGIGEFAGRFAALPGVLNVFFLAGVNDFSIHVAARSPDDLRDFVVRNLSASRDVASTETNLIFEHVGNARGLIGAAPEGQAPTADD